MNKEDFDIINEYKTLIEMIKFQRKEIKQERDNLQERINKAIEYITTEQLYTNYQWSEEQYKKILNDLLEILKGEYDERKY